MTSFNGKYCFVTGGAGGIGRALCIEFANRGAAGVAVVDLDFARANDVAQEIGARAVAVRCDLSRPDDVARAVSDARSFFGGAVIDVLASNAGIGLGDAPPDYSVISQTDAQWDLQWKVNVYATVLLLRHVLPTWTNRAEGGSLLITASAAGLLTSIVDSAYAATKHAAVALAESVRISHSHQNVRVSVLCPQYVQTNLLTQQGRNMLEMIRATDKDGILSPQEVAVCTADAMQANKFVVLPHKNVAKYFMNRAKAHDKWVDHMAKSKQLLRAAL